MTRINALSPRQVVMTREGAKAAADQYRPVRGRLEANYAIELVQSDHTLVDMIVVDDECRQPIGRPWLTLMIDVASRTVPGFHLTMLDLSAVSVGMAMRHAVLPNEPWLIERGMAASWTNEGVIDVTDVTPAIRAFEQDMSSHALRRTSRLGRSYRARAFAKAGGAAPSTAENRVESQPVATIPDIPRYCPSGIYTLRHRHGFRFAQ
ncbi:hypothetical protein M9979_15075 [Sphingomonas sp. RP10(2022)]|uniref:Uncharacterized protein n=1 Tax=Sphingomonas liriopis TaxID=2949094 RepID=A0A9X2I0D6_9SPHN|nr:hypothetical protein [Sphingomonas liriopis]MCP3736190.1 hypothetical protein [Sphingomonas liriopis]